MEKKQNLSRCYSGSATHIVLHQVRMVLLDSIIQDGHHHTFACVAQLPCNFSIQVMAVAVVLRGREQ